MGWIPEDQRDTRYYLWETKFECRMKYIDTFSIEDLQIFGTPTSGDRVRDRDVMEERVIRYLSINDMVEYFRQGIEIGVVKYADTARIYEYITNHLNAMRSEITHSFTAVHIPFDDLILLDQFANVVYDKAKYTFTRGDANSLIARKMGEVLPFNPDNILGSEKKVATVINAEGHEEEVDPYPKRDDFGSYFNSVNRRNRGRTR
jgi:hypothetical protein